MEEPEATAAALPPPHAPAAADVPEAADAEGSGDTPPRTAGSPGEPVAAAAAAGEDVNGEGGNTDVPEEATPAVDVVGDDAAHGSTPAAAEDETAGEDVAPSATPATTETNTATPVATPLDSSLLPDAVKTVESAQTTPEKPANLEPTTPATPAPAGVAAAVAAAVATPSRAATGDADSAAATPAKNGKSADASKVDANTVVVGVRIRPMNSREKACNEARILQVTGEAMNTVKTDSNTWTFDHVWDRQHSQTDIYDVLGKRVLNATMEGFNASIFAYGQTGSGKTHSMMGDLSNEAQKGLIPRLCTELLERTEAHTASAPEHTYEITMSFLEIYMEKVKDLMDLSGGDVGSAMQTPRDARLQTPRDLATPRDHAGSAVGNTSFSGSSFAFNHGGKGKPSLRVREHPVTGPYVDGLITKRVASLADILTCIEEGNAIRHTASTNMNNQSSRSHAVFSLQITHTIRTSVGGGASGAESSASNSPGNSPGGARGSGVPRLRLPRRSMTGAAPTPRGGKANGNGTPAGAGGDSAGNDISQSSTSKLVLVDLAGSERQKSTGAVGERLAEGAQINRSLTTLGLVINALAERCTSTKRTFVPYRDSTLTWLLRDTLGGNSRTCMLSTVSPAASQTEETVSTLRYANRAKMIVTQAVVNEDPLHKIIRALKEEIETYKTQAAQAKVRADSAELAAQARVQEIQQQHEEKILSYRIKMEHFGIAPGSPAGGSPTRPAAAAANGTGEDVGASANGGNAVGGAIGTGTAPPATPVTNASVSFAAGGVVSGGEANGEEPEEPTPPGSPAQAQQNGTPAVHVDAEASAAAGAAEDAPRGAGEAKQDARVNDVVVPAVEHTEGGVPAAAAGADSATEEYLRVALLLRQKEQQLDDLQQREEESREIRELAAQLKQREAAALEREKAWNVEKKSLEEQIARMAEELSSCRSTPMSHALEGGIVTPIGSSAPLNAPVHFWNGIGGDPAGAVFPRSAARRAEETARLNTELHDKLEAEQRACLEELEALFIEYDKREAQWTREKVKLTILINHWRVDSEDLIVALDAESANAQPSEAVLSRIKIDLGEAEMHLDEHKAFLQQKELQWEEFCEQIQANIEEQERLCERMGAGEAAAALRAARDARTDQPEKDYLLKLLDKKAREVQRLRERVDLPDRVRWAPDNSATSCACCQRPFTVFYRRHHCRNCGELVCGECSPFKQEVPRGSGKKVRVCVGCNMEMEGAL